MVIHSHAVVLESELLQLLSALSSPEDFVPSTKTGTEWFFETDSKLANIPVQRLLTWLQEQIVYDARYVPFLLMTLKRAGEMQRGLRLAVEHAARFQDEGETVLSALCLLVEAELMCLQYRFKAADPLLRRLESIRNFESDPFLNARCLEVVGRYYMLSGSFTNGRFESAHDRFEPAFDVYERHQCLGGMIRSLRGLIDAKSGLGRYYESLQTVEKALHLAIEHRVAGFLSDVITGEGNALRDVGHRTTTRQSYDLAVLFATAMEEKVTKARTISCYGALLANLIRPNDPGSLLAVDQMYQEALDILQDYEYVDITVQIMRRRADAFDRFEDFRLRDYWLKKSEQILAQYFESNTSIPIARHQLEKDFFDHRTKKQNDLIRVAVDQGKDAYLIFVPLRDNQAKIIDFQIIYRNRMAEEVILATTAGFHLASEAPPGTVFGNLSEMLISVYNSDERLEDRRVIPGDPDPRTVIFQAFPSQDGVVVVIQDISDTVRLTHQLEESLLQKDAAMKSRDRFLANMSHEVRTPINGVLGLARLLQKSPLTEQQNELVAGILEGGQMLRHVIGDVLDIVRIEQGEIQLQARPFAWSSVAQSVIRVFRGQVVEKGLALTYKEDPNLHPGYLGDSDRFRQVISNLIGNAIRFTDEGSITLEVNRVRHDSDTDTIEVAVEDTGIGISAQDQESIFEAFTQVNTEAGRHHGGTGLGLAICRQILSAMSGTIRVASVPGRGSRFTFEVELARAPHPVVAAEELYQPSPESEALAQGRQILVVEDNSLNRIVARHTLEGFGAEITEATSGTQAIQLASEQQFDLIFMDIRMPGLDGFETTDRIRRQTKNAATPIYALTAGALSTDPEECLRAGMNGYVAKPFTVDAIQECLTKVFSASQAAPTR